MPERSEPKHVKVYVELNDAAMQRGRERELRVWLLARSVDVDGSGVVAVSDIQTLIARQRLRGLSDSSLSRLLSAGSGVFWTVWRRGGQRWLRLVGLARVCVALGVERLRRRPVLVPMRYMRSMRTFRAAGVYARFAGDEFSRPISRSVLEELTGVAERTQRAYQRALSGCVESECNAATTRKRWRPGDEVEAREFVDYVDGETRVLQRLPQSYRCSLLATARGRIRKVNRRLRGEAGRNDGPAARNVTRLFYDSPAASVKRSQQRVEGDSWYHRGGDVDGRKTVKRSRCGAMLWTRNRIADGRLFSG